MFQEVIAEWLGRSVPDKGANKCYGMPFLLSTDIGLRRKENQDRVCAMAISAKSSSERPQMAVAVADGMGGMREGGACADLALSNFFYGLALYKDLGLTERAYAAIELANEAVYEFIGGKGGATLSAFIVDRDCRPIIVNLGDSRVYSFSRETGVNRLTVDDSMKEAVGGYGDELVQFVGMGEGMHPNVIPLDKEDAFLAITTDGVHSVEKSVFERILRFAEDFDSAADRLTSVAKWCGGHDNASIALVDICAAINKVLDDKEPGVRFFDPFGNLSTFWMKPGDNQNRKDVVDNKNEVEEGVKIGDNVDVKNKKSRKGLGGGGFRGKGKRENKDKKEQLSIEIIQENEQGERDEDK